MKEKYNNKPLTEEEKAKWREGKFIRLKEKTRRWLEKYPDSLLEYYIGGNRDPLKKHLDELFPFIAHDEGSEDQAKEIVEDILNNVNKG